MQAITRGVEKVMQLNIFGTLRARRLRNCKLDITLYRNASLKVKRTASIVGSGKLHVGMKWPAYHADKTLVSVWDGATLIVDGDFRIHSGCRIVVDTGARLELGSGYLNSSSSISCFDSVKIGNDVAIAEKVTIRDSDNHSITGSAHPQHAPITIGDKVWIGTNVTILKGVTIGSGSIIAAGSVVNKSIPAGCLAGGIPAKVIRENVAWT
jgi:acetyltransferase-like isoleucine patch superfamily enzyme